jgi:hypothetical protein
MSLPALLPPVGTSTKSPAKRRPLHGLAWVAAITGYSEAHLRRLARQKRLPGVTQIGKGCRHIVRNQVKLMDWLESKTCQR